jgi:LPS-assembly protein
MQRGVLPCLSALLAAMALDATAAEPPSIGHAPVLFSANEVQYDEELGLVVAKGDVEISQEDQILLADTITYNQRTDTITASGHVSFLQPSGDVIFADFVELHDNMREGFVRDLRMLLADRSRLAGNTARRVAGTRIEVRRGVYSPCDPCREDPTRPPIWQIKGEQIVDDKDLQVVEYRDAVMELSGVPILYAPYFSHPDPSVKRQSGFLAPVVATTPSNGFEFRLPYYWAIDQDKDTTFLPMVTATGGFFLGDEYRERFSNGQLTADGSVTFGSTRSTIVDPEPVPGVRGDLFATGELDLSQDWRTGLQTQLTSDQTYLLRYHLPSPANFLTNHVYGEEFGTQSYANISGWAWQSLRPGVGNSIEPFITPIANYNWVSQPDALGGRIAVEGDALNLYRIQGVDMRRLSAGGAWQVPYTTPIGDRYTLSLSLRTDGYSSDDVPVGGVGSPTENPLAGRVFPQLALTWQYPWVRRGENYSQLIEPVVMLAAAPNGLNPSTIPNEDSQGFEFDDTALFVRNRFPGFDRVDSGQRVDYGLRAGVYGNSGGSTSLLIGQSYTAEVNPAYLPGSGLNHNFSDVVGRVTVSPAPYLDFIYRFRLNYANLALNQQSVAGGFGPTNLHFVLSYIQVQAISGIPELAATKQIQGTLNVQLTRYWSAQMLGTFDLAPSPPVTAAGTPITTVNTGETLNSGISLTYRDECIAFVTSITYSGITNGDVKPGTSFLFSIVLKNIGDFGGTLATF